MKLSELVNYREHIVSLMPTGLDQYVHDQFDRFIFQVDTGVFRIPGQMHNLQRCRDNIKQGFDDFVVAMNLVLETIDKEIENRRHEYFAISYKVYEETREDFNIFDVRILDLDESQRAFLESRVQYHCDWKYAAAVIRPGRDTWVDLMVASDPLYVLEINHDLLQPTKEKFNEVYQRRVRYNIIDESTNNLLPNLPNEQFGFVFAYNFFNYRPFELLKFYMQEAYQKLKPGGTMAFTFNDCDRRGGVELVERFSGCFTPGTLVKAMAETMGFEVTLTKELNAAVSWIELKKPGELTSIRGGQSLAQLVAKSK